LTLQSGKSSAYELIQQEAQNSFQILLVHIFIIFKRQTEKVPFCISVNITDVQGQASNLLLHFKSLKEYTKFKKLLKEFNFQQIPTDFTKLESKLSSKSIFLKIKKKEMIEWTQMDLCEWLSYLFVGEFSLGRLYEDFLVPHIAKGSNLCHLDSEILNILGVSEQHRNVLIHEIETLQFPCKPFSIDS
jgi:ASC-1-like (ASCH) protein